MTHIRTKARLITGLVLMILAVGAGGAAAMHKTPPAELSSCPGTVNPDTFKCEEGNCGINENCCGCTEEELFK